MKKTGFCLPRYVHQMYLSQTAFSFFHRHCFHMFLSSFYSLLSLIILMLICSFLYWHWRNLHVSQYHSINTNEWVGQTTIIQENIEITGKQKNKEHTRLRSFNYKPVAKTELTRFLLPCRNMPLNQLCFSYVEIICSRQQNEITFCIYYVSGTLDLYKTHWGLCFFWRLRIKNWVIQMEFVVIDCISLFDPYVHSLLHILELLFILKPAGH